MEDRWWVSPDESDFRHVYERASPTVYRVAYRLSGRRETAEDATQEAFARAFERWARLRGEPWVVGWIVTTALNILRRTARRTPDAASGLRGTLSADGDGGRPEVMCGIGRAASVDPAHGCDDGAPMAARRASKKASGRSPIKK
jgi:RNA polymerase sigma-70 factor (ECF subfamily)